MDFPFSMTREMASRSSRRHLKSFWNGKAATRKFLENSSAHLSRFYGPNRLPAAQAGDRAGGTGIEKGGRSRPFRASASAASPYVKGEVAPRGIGRGAQCPRLRRGPYGRAAVLASPLEGGEIPVCVDITRASAWYWLPRRATYAVRAVAHLAPDPDGEHAGGGDMATGRRIIRALLRIRRTGRASTIGRVRSSTNGDCSRAFWLAPVRAGFGDGLFVGVLAGGVVEADQPRRLPAAVRAPGCGAYPEDRGAGPVLGLDVQVTDSKRNLHVGE